MNNKKLKKKPYSILIKKILKQTIFLLASAVVLVTLLRSASYGHLADTIVSIISRIFNVDWYRASSIYLIYIRNYINSIIFAVIAIFFIIFFRFALSWFTKYFDEIISGVDQLLIDDNSSITMSEEMNFIEEKLNHVKSELKRRAIAEQQAEQHKNDLVLYLAHDIKTPLTSVIGYLNLLDEVKEMPDDQRTKYVHISLEKAYRLEKLINEFFEVTRYSMQHVPIHKEEINLCYMMVQIADEAYPQLLKNNQKVKINIAEGLAILGDSEKLARVFNNILKNAISYSKPNCEITISASYDSKEITIEFQNPGNIPPEDRERIFEKFYRLDTARSTSTGGAGLGLAISKYIIDLHGGSISVSSDNGYIVFKVCLPR